MDELEQFDLWKVREIRRVKKEREAREAAEREKREIERRRNLTDAQRKAEDDAFNRRAAISRAPASVCRSRARGPVPPHDCAAEPHPVATGRARGTARRRPNGSSYRSTTTRALTSRMRMRRGMPSLGR